MARGLQHLEEEEDELEIRKQHFGPPSTYGTNNSIPRPDPVNPPTAPSNSTTMIPNDQEDKIGGDGYGSSKMRASNWRLMGLGMFFLFYLALGASVFSAIESPIEQQEIKDLIDRKKAFINGHKCVDAASLDDLINAIVEADNRGVTLAPMADASYGNTSEQESVPSWSFGQSFFFASTVVTTIGYGHQSPLSTSGKVFCMVYALIGIPLTMLLLTAVVERLLIPTTLMLKWMNTKLGHLHTPFFIRVLHLFIIVTMIIGFLFLLPAAIFTALEPKWGYSDALYYCFISLTTIGLGDFIPGDNTGQHLRPLYKACTTIYLLIGVTAMMLTLSVFYSIPEFDISTLFLLSCGSGVNGNLGNNGNLPTIRASGASSLGDPERIHLRASGGNQYTQHIDESESGGGASSMDRLQTRRVVRARSRPDEDTPDEDEAPIPGPSGRVRLR